MLSGTLQIAFHPHREGEVVVEEPAGIEASRVLVVGLEQRLELGQRLIELAGGDEHAHPLAGREPAGIDGLVQPAAEGRARGPREAGVTGHAVVHQLGEQKAGLLAAAALEATLDLGRVERQGVAQMRETHVPRPPVLVQRAGAALQRGQGLLQRGLVLRGPEVLDVKRER